MKIPNDVMEQLASLSLNQIGDAIWHKVDNSRIDQLTAKVLALLAEEESTGAENACVGLTLVMSHLVEVAKASPHVWRKQ